MATGHTEEQLQSFNTMDAGDANREETTMVQRDPIDVVFGLHDFDAENPDEISFRAGEKVIVYEKDDLYQDGWWQGENSRGETGLFPKSYTGTEPPVTTPEGSPKVVDSAALPAEPASSHLAIPEGAGVAAVVSGNGAPRSRPPSRGGETPEMRATIDDIQNHLDGMYGGKQASGVAGLPGTQPPQGTSPPSSSNPAHIEPEPAASVPLPKEAPMDDGASIASRSIHDDASSVLDGEVAEGDRAKQGEQMATNAKQNLARNIELAKEREQEQIAAAERAREAERERMRASGPPIQGLVVSDESDSDDGAVIEDSDEDDDDSIFPTRRQRQEEPAEDYQTQPITQTRAVEEPQVLRFEPIPAATPPQQGLPVSSATTIDPPALQRGESQLPGSFAEPHLFLKDEVQSSTLPPSSSTSSVYQPTPQQTPLGEDKEQEPPLPTSATQQSSPLSQQYDTVTPKPPHHAVLAEDTSPQSRMPEEEVEEIRQPAETSPEDEQRPSIGNRKLSIDTAIASAGVISAANGSPRSSVPRRSIDAGVAPGESGLISLVQQAQTQQPLPVQPTSPYQSTVNSSRPSSVLGTAFTPATTAPNHSPRSGNFKQRPNGDPRDWSVEQVVEWGQSKNFDSSILGKFAEHEISGDVLLDMDINTLKEIDILTFGPRARIAKAIKELRSQYDIAQPLSPSGQSGYEPGTPSSTAVSPLPVTGSQYDRFSSSTAPRTPESASDSRGYGGQSSTAESSQPSHSRQQSRQLPSAIPTDQGSIRGLGLQEPVSQSPAPSPTLNVPSSDPLSNTAKTSRNREASSGTHNTGGSSSHTAEEAEELRDGGLPEPTENGGTGMRKSKSSLGNVSNPFNRSRQKSKAGSIASPEMEQGETRNVPPKSGSRFFGNTLTRNRKPPPAYPSDTEGGRTSAEKASPRPSASSNRLSTRLFGSGGTPSGFGDDTSNGTRASAKPVISAPLETQTPTSPTSGSALRNRTKTSDSATTAVPTYATSPTGPTNASATTPTKTVRAADALGDPDYEGWLRKRSDKYNTMWKERYLILKDGHLYVLKSKSEEKIKGWIDLTGYKFVSDGSVDRGRYGFKALHDSLQTYYFSSNDSTVTRNWMKALMKATIGRDYSAPVTSSCNIKTIPLSVAQAMNPPPRPPSPTSASRVQKASVQQNPNSLSAQDAAKLMGASIIPGSPSATPRGGSITGPSSPTRNRDSVSTGTSPLQSKKKHSLIPPLRSSQRKKPVSERTSISSISGMTLQQSQQQQPQQLQQQQTAISNWPERQRQESFSTQGVSPSTRTSAAFTHSNPEQELLDWVNDHLPNGTAKAFEWTDMNSGRIYTRLVENLSGKTSGITDREFDAYVPYQPGRAPDAGYLDVMFRFYDYMLDRRINTDDVSINDLLNGHVPHLIKLANIIRIRFET